jgi:hypothetical protein
LYHSSGADTFLTAEHDLVKAALIGAVKALTTFIARKALDA